MMTIVPHCWVVLLAAATARDGGKFVDGGSCFYVEINVLCIPITLPMKFALNILVSCSVIIEDVVLTTPGGTERNQPAAPASPRKSRTLQG